MSHVPPATADLLPALVAHAEEPLADNSLIPLYVLSEFTRRHVTVALSGDGADELLAGYATYRASRWAPWYRRMPGPLRHWLIEPLVQRLASLAAQVRLAAIGAAIRGGCGAERRRGTTPVGDRSSRPLRNAACTAHGGSRPASWTPSGSMRQPWPTRQTGSRRWNVTCTWT